MSVSIASCSSPTRCSRHLTWPLIIQRAAPASGKLTPLDETVNTEKQQLEWSVVSRVRREKFILTHCSTPGHARYALFTTKVSRTRYDVIWALNLSLRGNFKQNESENERRDFIKQTARINCCESSGSEGIRSVLVWGLLRERMALFMSTTPSTRRARPRSPSPV